MRRLELITRRHPNWSLFAVFVILTLAAFVLVATTGLRDALIIGDCSHPGLQGEVLFQGHMLYNVQHGNWFAS